MTHRWRPLTRLEGQFAAGIAILLWCACAPSRPTPLDYGGNWSGTTSQNAPFSFTVSADLRVSTVTIGYRFSGCSGTLTIPADVALLNTSGNAVAVVTSAPSGPTGPDRVTVHFLFSSITTASGTADFADIAGCGSSTAEWNAQKR